MADIATTSSDSIDPVAQGVMNVSQEDQQKINLFARLNARWEDASDDITNKVNELKNYEDAYNEAELKVLEDSGDKLHIQVGDIMVNMNSDKVLSWLEEKKEALQKALKEAEINRTKILEELVKLKAHLYARFGNNIHLESGP